MKITESYDNLIEAINSLRKQGYTEDFNIKINCLECGENKIKVFHNEFVIDKYFRFEDSDSSPNGSSILYAISSERYNLKGILINAYGIYSDDISNEIVEKLHF